MIFLYRNVNFFFEIGTDKALIVDKPGNYALSPLDSFSQNTIHPQLFKILHPYTDNWFVYFYFIFSSFFKILLKTKRYYFSYNAHSGDGLHEQLLVQVFLNKTTPTLFVKSLQSMLCSGFISIILNQKFNLKQ